MDHLDDFPSAAWAYAALANNQTQDFLALLYGHMATYSSRGTFHATEQLRFESDGDAYRHYSPTYKGDVRVASLNLRELFPLIYLILCQLHGPESAGRCTLCAGVALCANSC
jgi:hypothetical protein